MRRPTVLRTIFVMGVAVTAFACCTKAQKMGPPLPTDQDAQNTTAIAEISFVHGGAEPFAVAGYRMGERALKEFKLQRGTFLLEVTHNAPNEVQWCSIVDGVQVATGASEGKLNLKVVSSAPGDTFTSIRDRRSGKTLVFRLKPQFTARFLSVSHDKLDAAGLQVLNLPDDQIFFMASTQ